MLVVIKPKNGVRIIFDYDNEKIKIQQQKNRIIPQIDEHRKNIINKATEVLNRKTLIPKDNNFKNSARTLFLINIEEIAPEVLKDLYDKIFPLIPGQEDPCPELKKWIDKYNLPKDWWFFEQSIDTMRLWKRYPEYAGKLWCTYSVNVYNRVESKKQFIFKHAGWDPFLISREDIEKAITEEFQECLREYLDSIEKKYLESGFVPTNEKFTKARKVDNFKWFVEYQIRELYNAPIG